MRNFEVIVGTIVGVVMVLFLVYAIWFKISNRQECRAKDGVLIHNHCFKKESFHQ